MSRCPVLRHEPLPAARLLQVALALLTAVVRLLPLTAPLTWPGPLRPLDVLPG